MRHLEKIIIHKGMTINLNDNVSVLQVDFRDQLKTRFSPFVMEANRFIINALTQFDSIKNEAKKNQMALKITNDWLDMLNMRDVVDIGFMPTKSEMAGYCGLSLEEVLLLEATAYAENMGLNITQLEKLALEHNIYGPNFPGRSKEGFDPPYRGHQPGKPNA